MLRATRDAADRQATDMRQMVARVEALKEEVHKLQAEKQTQVEVAAEHARSTAKGRPYEEAVADAVDAVAVARGDDCDAVGDVRGTGGRKGDVLVGIDGCAGPARGRIVFEAKNSRRSRNEALAELDDAMAQRDADYAVWVVPSEDLLPRKTQQLREVNGDKLFVVYEPEDGSRLALEVGYALARARVLMAKGAQDDLDVSAVVAETERALGAMEDVRRIKSQLTNASTGIDEAREIVRPRWPASPRAAQPHRRVASAKPGSAEAVSDRRTGLHRRPYRDRSDPGHPRPADPRVERAAAVHRRPRDRARRRGRRP